MDPLICLTVSGALAVLFASSAIQQSASASRWVEIVRNYQLVPAVLAAPIAGLIVALQSLVAVGLLWAPRRALAACAAAGLLLAFGGAMWLNIRRGRTQIDCGCSTLSRGGGLSQWMIWRNVVLAALALTLTLPVGTRSLSATELLVSALWVLTLSFLYPVIGVILRPLARRQT